MQSALLALLASLSFPQPQAKTAPTNDYVKTWGQVESAIRSRYYARETRQADIDRLIAKYGPVAKASKDKVAFETTVNQMIADFHDSHFDFLTTDDQGFYVMDGLARGNQAAEMPEIGAWFKRTGDTYTVRMVLDDSEAQKAGLRKGDVMLSVDGKPFSPVASFANKADQHVSLTYRRGDAVAEVKVRVTNENALEMFLDASRDSTRIIEQNDRKIGYFHLWTQANDSFRRALSSAVEGKLRDTDAFILDLRDGFGGRPEGYGDPFFRPEVRLRWGGPKGQRQLFGYQRPLIVLINEGSRSAKEILSYIFKTSKRAVLMGSTTAGNVLGTFPQKLNSWSYLELPAMDVETDGIRLEGKGVAPDVVLPVEIDANGKDLFLAAALDRLKDVPKTKPW